MRPGLIPWYAIHKALCEKVRGLVPEDVGRITLAEVALLLDDGKRSPIGAPSMTTEEGIAEWQRWQAMTPLEKLRNFQRF